MQLFLILMVLIFGLTSGVSAAEPVKAPPPVFDLKPEKNPVQPTQAELYELIKTAEGRGVPEVDGTEKNQFIGYAWPYQDLDIAAELGEAPIVVELFTTQGCVFCPAADAFFRDLVARAPNVIGLACHVNYLDVRKGSLSQHACTNRQGEYSKSIPGGAVYSPQIVIDGRKSGYGFDYTQILSRLRDARTSAPQRLTVKKLQGYEYEISVLAIDKKSSVQLEILTYRKPVDLTIADGDNRGRKMRYERAVTSIRAVPVDAGSKVLRQEIVPGSDDAGAVVLLRGQNGITAVSDLAF